MMHTDHTYNLKLMSLRFTFAFYSLSDVNAVTKHLFPCISVTSITLQLEVQGALELFARLELVSSTGESS